MQNVGDRLAEARKRLGIALREASEATKIRTDYLMAMENGSFEFSLPEIYKIGFLKIYARFLKLDADKLAADYATQFTGAGRGDRDNLGRMDAPGGVAPGGAAARETPAGEYDAERAKNQMAMFRLMVFLGFALVVLVLLIIGLEKLLNGGASGDNPGKVANAAVGNTTGPDAATPAPATAPTASTTPPAPALLKFVFTATGNITSLQVTQRDGRQSLYNKALNKGESLPLSSKGPVEINVSEVKFLTIQVNGGPAQGIAGGNHQALAGPLDFIWPPS